ncbi:hypothetical protein SUGI_0114260 [Cryptomeria japonica]|uniref:uncharacterized protein LOC131054282 n=1 Tax=Cryptomeria japonica TaxID=3369 RepID=UPI002408B76B|nr:uncharacterized protein LOC131054282 [Cryptomeria japonica]GLJ09692.1 hypothetical protein SUGI_0114260 [Cryptomeria japonica]
MRNTLDGSGSSSTSVKGFMQRRRYKRLNEFNGGRKDSRLVKLGGHKERRGWKLKVLPKLNLRIVKLKEKVSAKSWVGKMRDAYVKMMFSLSQKRIKQTPAKMGIEDFNNKMAVEIYRSIGIQAEVLRRQTSRRSIK